MPIEITLKYSDYAKIRNHKALLNDLRDQAAIDFWETINQLDLAFGGTHKRIVNANEQINELKKEAKLTRQSIQKNKEMDDKQRRLKLEEAGEAWKEKNGAKVSELNEEIINARKTEKTVAITPLNREDLTRYGLVSFEVLDVFSLIIEKPGADEELTEEAA